MKQNFLKIKDHENLRIEDNRIVFPDSKLSKYNKSVLRSVAVRPLNGRNKGPLVVEGKTVSHLIIWDARCLLISGRHWSESPYWTCQQVLAPLINYPAWWHEVSHHIYTERGLYLKTIQPFLEASPKHSSYADLLVVPIGGCGGEIVSLALINLDWIGEIPELAVAA